MLEAVAIFASVITVFIVFFVFRRPLSKFNTDAASIVEKTMKTAVATTQHWELEVSTRCSESELDCRRRMKAVEEKIKQESLPDIQEAYDFIMNYDDKNK